jgi:hypothetical protein
MQSSATRPIRCTTHQCQMDRVCSPHCISYAASGSTAYRDPYLCAPCSLSSVNGDVYQKEVVRGISRPWSQQACPSKTCEGRCRTTLWFRLPRETLASLGNIRRGSLSPDRPDHLATVWRQKWRPTLKIPNICTCVTSGRRQAAVLHARLNDIPHSTSRARRAVKKIAVTPPKVSLLLRAWAFIREPCRTTRCVFLPLHRLSALRSRREPQDLHTSYLAIRSHCHHFSMPSQGWTGQGGSGLQDGMRGGRLLDGARTNLMRVSCNDACNVLIRWNRVYRDGHCAL